MAGKSDEQMPRMDLAKELLGRAYASGMRDAELLTALAGIARDSNRADKGIELAVQGLQLDDLTLEGRLELTDILAELQFRSGKFSKQPNSSGLSLRIPAARCTGSCWELWKTSFTMTTLHCTRFAGQSNWHRECSTIGSP
ncbi:MAG: hypothetical protein R3C19_16370 [Planctomycetaceae bacterium]